MTKTIKLTEEDVKNMIADNFDVTTGQLHIQYLKEPTIGVMGYEETMEVTITNENFETLKNGAEPLVIDFWATWCGPCRMIGPVISQLAKEYEGKITVAKCDVEECEDIAVDLGIRNVPTILFFKGGELVDKFVGAGSKAVLKEKFEALL